MQLVALESLKFGANLLRESSKKSTKSNQGLGGSEERKKEERKKERRKISFEVLKIGEVFYTP